jgi:hypothetical protein
MRGMRRVAFLLIAVVLGLATAGCVDGRTARSSQPTPRASPPALSPSWIITAGAVQRLEQAGLPSSSVQADFDRPSTLLLVQQGKVDKLVPRASLAFVFTSAASLVAALQDGRVPSAVHWLLLDLEYWPLTPVGEQKDPISALGQAVAAAHAAGRRLVFTPAVDLLSVLDANQPAPRAPARYTGTPADDFQRLVVRPGAAASDVFEVQSQETEATPYATTFAPGVIAAARAAHPGQEVLAGLSTNPNGRQVTPTDLLTLYRAAAAAGAAGYWLNVPQAGRECPKCGVPQPQVAVQFLESRAGRPARPEASARAAQAAVVGATIGMEVSRPK